MVELQWGVQRPRVYCYACLDLGRAVIQSRRVWLQGAGWCEEDNEKI